MKREDLIIAYTQDTENILEVISIVIILIQKEKERDTIPLYANAQTHQNVYLTCA